MTTPGIIMWATVLLIGVPSAWRNPTAAALVGAWVVTKTIWLITGNGLAVEFFIFPDLAVIAIVFMKPDYRPCDRYRGTLHQFKCILTERSPADRIVLLIYPVEWAIYCSALHPFYVWWLLWSLSIVQFLAVGGESLSRFIRRDADAVTRPPVRPGPLLTAGGWSG
jgi:hypothetical protein